MRYAAIFCCLCLSLFSSALTTDFARAQQEQTASALHIGIITPLDGPYALLGKQIRLGAEAAKIQNQYPVSLVFMPEHCKAKEDTAVAEKIRLGAKTAKIQLVIGYLCSESLMRAAPILARDNIAVLSLGSRQPNIAELQVKNNFGIFRLQAERNRAIELLLDQLLPTWRNLPFALIEDGTVQGRDFARQVLAVLKARGLEPALTDTYRPAQTAQNALIARLKRAGINHILLGGEGADASVIARSAAAAGLPLTIAGNDMLLHDDPANPLPVGLLMSALPDVTLMPGITTDTQTAIKAINALARKEDSTGDMQAEGYALLAYSAMQIAYQALTRPAEPQLSLTDYLLKNHFETASGPISFTDEGLRRENPYRLMRFDGKIFVPVQ